LALWGIELPNRTSPVPKYVSPTLSEDRAYC
jgi:hypothetical protein